MTTTTRRTVWMTLLLTLAAWTAPALAQQPPGPGPGDRPGRGERMRLHADAGMRSWWNNPRVVEKLQLTPDQQKQIEDLAYRSGQRLIDLRADRHKAQLDLSHLLSAETLDTGAVDKAVERVAEVGCAIEREQLKLRADIARVLTKEQRVQVANLRETIREGRRGGR